jgi:hypothetical protein
MHAQAKTFTFKDPVKQENKTAESSMEDCHKQLDEKYLISVA